MTDPVASARHLASRAVAAEPRPWIPPAPFATNSASHLPPSKPQTNNRKTPLPPPTPTTPRVGKYFVSGRPVIIHRPLPGIPICPGDTRSPRIHRVMIEYASICPGRQLPMWLCHMLRYCKRHLCESKDCTFSEGLRNGMEDDSNQFFWVHGIKTLLEFVPMFLSYYVPYKFVLKNGDDWSNLLRTIRSFYMFCVIRKYLKEDIQVMNDLYLLDRFKIVGIPSAVTRLCKEKYWTGLENTGKETDSPPSSKRQKTKRSDVKSEDKLVEDNLEKEQTTVTMTELEDEIEDFEDICGKRSTITIVEHATDEGWVLRINERDIFLHLPADVALMGMPGMDITSLVLGKRNGIWRPVWCPSHEAYIGRICPPMMTLKVCTVG